MATGSSSLGGNNPLGNCFINPQVFNGIAKGINKAALLQGGFDILIRGDSRARGAVSESTLNHGVGSLFQLGLQARYNPTGVQGGRGFIPCTIGSGSSWNNPNTGVQSATPWPTTGTIAYTGRFSTTPGVQVVRINQGATATVAYTFDGAATDAVFARKGITSLAVVTYGPNSGTNVPFTLYNNTTTTMISTGNFDASSVSGAKFTVPTGCTGLNPLQSYTFTISAPVSGGNVWVSGCIAYNGDEQCGVRLHNLANWGSRLVDPDVNSTGLLAATLTASRAEALASNGTSWATENSLALNAVTGPKRALMSFNFYDGTNDDGGNVLASDFQAQVNNLNAADIAAGISPVWITHPAADGKNVSIRKYHDILINSAINSNGTVGCLDLYGFLDRPAFGSTTAGFMFNRGWGASDGVHYLSGWHKWEADMLLACTDYGVAYCRQSGLGY